MLKRVAAAAGGEALPPVRQRLRSEALALAEAERLVDAAFCYRIVDLEALASAHLRVGGEVLHAPRLLPESGRLTAVACGVCTLGPALETRIAALFSERRVALAVALDQLSNLLLFEASRRMEDRIALDVSRRRLTMAGELRAGDPGLAIEAQGAVARLAGAESKGIRVTGGYALHPQKSTSVVFGVGIDLPPASWSRCDDCASRAKCCHPGRRALAEAGAGAAR